MNHYKLILPEHLNHHDKLFGGNMLKWIDEFAYITANIEFPGYTFLTKALDNVVFLKSVSVGEIVCFKVHRQRLGNTSVQYSVKAFGTKDEKTLDEVIFETKITFVSVDENNNKVAIDTTRNA